MEIRSRETVILAENFSSLVEWYREVLGFRIVQMFENGFHYCNLDSERAGRLAIGSASEMGVSPTDRSQNTVVLQWEVDDVRDFLSHVEASGGRVMSGPSFNKKESFWFGAFADPEGNPFWVVDKNCP